MLKHRIQALGAGFLLLLFFSTTNALFAVNLRTPRARGGRLSPLSSAAVADLWTANGTAPFSLVAGGLNGAKKDAYSGAIWQVSGREWRLLSDNNDKKSASVPSPRSDAAAWAITGNNNTKLYMFGGFGTASSDGSKDGESGFLQDLRVFDLQTQLWTLLSGSSSVNGTTQLGAFATPGSRADAVRWTDGSNLYLYGGIGYDRNVMELLEDFWRFSLSNAEWTRISRTSLPGARASAAVSRFGEKVYLFGGESYTSTQGYLEASNDLWVWANGEFTLISSPVANASYETLGVKSPTAHPGRRAEAVLYATADRLWLYGGVGYDASGNFGVLSDVWSFDFATSQWAWIAGSSSRATAGAGQLPPPRAHAVSWPFHNNTYSSLWVYGGYADHSGSPENELFEFIDYPDSGCTPQTGCMCSGLPISSEVVCIGGSWVFVTNEQTSSFSVFNPPPVSVGSVLDVKLHSLNIVGDISIAGTITAAFDMSSSLHGSLVVGDGCPYVADGATVQVDVSGIEALLNQPRKVVLLEWDSVVCGNYSSPSFSDIVAAPSASSSSSLCGSVQTQQQLEPGSLSIIFTFVPSPDCPVAPSQRDPDAPSGGGGGITDPNFNNSSTIAVLPLVFGLLALVVVAVIIAGVVIYRRRYHMAKEEAIGAAVSSLYNKSGADAPPVQPSGATSGDAGWWIDAPESPRSVTSRDERDGTVPVALTHVGVAPTHQEKDVADSLPIPDLSVDLITPRGPIASPSNVSIPSKSKMSDTIYVEVAGSGDSDSSASGSLRIVSSSRSSRNRRIVQHDSSSKNESDAGSESDSASDSEFVKTRSMVHSHSASSIRHQRAMIRSQTDLSSSSTSVASSGLSTPTIDIDEDDVEFDRSSSEEAANIVYLGKWMGTRVSLRATTLVLSDESLQIPSMQSILFMSELRAIVELPPHKNVIRVFGHFQRRKDSTHFLVTEHASRGSLSGILPSGSLSVREKIKIIERTAAGLAHLHENGILMHKYMNASSVLMDAALRPKLSNYGMLLSEKHAASKNNEEWMSSARWLAPEVCRQGTFSIASDVYSFGVFITQVLTEKIPFDGLSDVEAMMEIAEHSSSPDVPEWCPRYLREVAQVCMNEDVRERPDMDDVVALLRMVRRGSIASELESV